ncbi:MAG: Ribonuclease PH [Chroococcopsis gigantea SAG 12.99]|jgi:ribonuclease PH|nr:ribonuclease PH [Chlorogloea purpurea SAG 13.99]MDV3001744.1 Ribonuclease PH [Chroococcopsis gigantea SAG 12.99]
MSWQRPDDRTPAQLRPVVFQVDYTRYSAGSVLACCGDTKVLCNVAIQPGVPKFLFNSGKGWLTAEYRMLPQATHQRHQRELVSLSGRTQEIQRLIGRSLRSCLDFSILGEKTIIVDADVIQADAGTRTTAITGGYVALSLAVKKLLATAHLEKSPLVSQVAAISVGLIEGQPYLDLNYLEDTRADVDFNVVMRGDGNLIEVQGTAEADSFSRQQLNQILDLAESGIKQLFELQRSVIN